VVSLVFGRSYRWHRVESSQWMNQLAVR